MERWRNAPSGAGFEVSDAATMMWSAEQSRELRRSQLSDVARRKRVRDERAAAPFGGPVAVLAFDEYDGQDEEGGWEQGEIRVFDAAGKPLFTKPWHEGKLAPGGFGWVQGGILVAVLEAGDSVILFRSDPANTTPRVIGLPTKPSPIQCAHIWDGGFIAITEDYQVIESTRLTSTSSYSVRVRAKLPAAILGEEKNPIRTLAVLRPFIHRDEPEQALVAVALPSAPGIFVIEPDGTIRSQFANSSVVAVSERLVPHPTYRLIATYGVDGKLSVLPFDFCEVLVQYDCNQALLGVPVDSLLAKRPTSVHWCGMSTFALGVTWPQTYWTKSSESALLVLSLEHCFTALSRAHLKGSGANNSANTVTEGGGTNVSSIKEGVQLSLPSSAWATLEVDGIRLTAHDKVRFLRSVPDSIKSIYTLGSTEPAAMLLDAVDILRGGDPSANANIRGLIASDKIQQAVETCLEAAEFFLSSSPEQHQLLQAAAYGKRFFHLTTSGKTNKSKRTLSQRFVETCQHCRICALVLKDAGFVLTTRQLRVLTPALIIDRLLFYAKFRTAAELCQAAKVPMERVLVFWTRAKIKATPENGSDLKLLVAIEKRVDECRIKYGTAASFAAIASVAAMEGRVSLAKQLAERERKVSNRILFLLSIAEYESALRVLVAKESIGMDPDLEMFVASECYGGLPWDSLVTLCDRHREVFSVFKSYLCASDQTAYKQLLLALDKKKTKAMILAEESCASYSKQERIRLVEDAASEFKAAGCKHYSLMSSEQARLLERQYELGDNIVGLSLANSVLDCFRRGLDSEAEAFASEFKLDERSFRRLQLRGLVARKDWAKIEELSCQAAVRNVLSDADFVEACIFGGNTETAKRYLSGVANADDRKSSLCLSLGLYPEAVEAAYQIGNLGALNAIQRRKPDMTHVIQEKIDMLRATGPPIKLSLEGKERPALFHAAKESCAQQ